MKSDTLYVGTALIVLFSQLLALNPVFSFSSYTYGDFRNSVEKITIVQRHVVYEAVFASQATRSSDALVFTGDIMLGRNVEYLMNKEGTSYPFSGLHIPSLFSNAAVIGNFESSMAVDHVETPAYAMKFSVSEAVLGDIKQAGFTHLSLGNNHSYDYGVAGYKNAIEKLSDYSFTPFGSGIEVGSHSITITKTSKGDIALIGINASEQIPSHEDIARVLKVASKRSPFQVVYVHWGNEYELTHSPTQRMLAEMFVDAGADLIIGHHPHVTQDIDIIKGVVVFYSLGNYIFDQYFSNDVQEGLLVGLDVVAEPILTLIPVTSKNTLSQPTVMEPAAHQQFLENLAKRSHPSLQEKIRTGTIPLLDTVATSTKVAMM
jgi:gamma-polyglutamate biosynthesis protein CapA